MTHKTQDCPPPDLPDDIVREMAKAAVELASFASYAEIVGAVTHNAKQVREWSDRVFELNRRLDKKLDEAEVPYVSDTGSLLMGIERYAATLPLDVTAPK